MKKLMTIVGAFFFASVVLTSCGGEPTACDCAELSMEALVEAMEFLDDPAKAEEIVEKWENKLIVKACKDLSEKDAGFKEEMTECLMTLMSEE
mgnify:FL=1|tara:strand:+ start:866 stop:1144 length:279 start_codon:yes stop_codon:yes gene_type:complete